MALEPAGSIKRAAIAVHRWLGVALCLLFAVWFASGIGMMYFDFPAVAPADRLERSPALDGSRINISPQDAVRALGPAGRPVTIRIDLFDGRPAYRIRSGSIERLVFADTGQERRVISPAMMDRAAAAWTGQPRETATVRSIDVDQWTVQGSFRNLRPLWQYAWPNGEQVYVSQASGEVVQYTTTASRLRAYLGPIPHWVYFTPLRAKQSLWSRFVIWTSGAGTVAALLGIAIGIWTYSPSKRYRRSGLSTSIPYAGWKRWHMVLGLFFGAAGATWAFSGMLSMDPFPLSPGDAGSNRERGAAVANVLRAPLDLAQFDDRSPRDVLAALRGLDVRQIELVAVAGGPAYLVRLAHGQTRVVPVKGEPREGFDRRQIEAALGKAASASGIAECREVDRYDRYYLDRRRQRPLPVLLVRLADTDATRYYIDLRTAQIVGRYSSGAWASRWLYHGLHSLDFPWLYEHRPLWDVTVIAFMAGGTGLSATSLLLAWRVIRRKAT